MNEGTLKRKEINQMVGKETSLSFKGGRNMWWWSKCASVFHVFCLIRFSPLGSRLERLLSESHKETKIWFIAGSRSWLVVLLHCWSVSYCRSPGFWGTLARRGMRRGYKIPLVEAGGDVGGTIIASLGGKMSWVHVGRILVTMDQWAQKRGNK